MNDELFDELKKENYLNEGLLNNSNKMLTIQKINRMGVIGVINLTLSFYLAFGQTEDGTCDFSDKVSCSQVLSSKYGKILGVPVAFFGITWNLVFLFILYKLTKGIKIPYYLTLNYFWNCIAMGFVAYFVVAEFIIGSICPFCTVVHILNIILMVYSFNAYTHILSPPLPMKILEQLKNVFIGIVFLHLSLVILYHLNKVPEISSDDFTMCLTKHNMVFYGSSKCHACVNQKQLFQPDIENSPWRHINFVECFENDECNKREITRYPTWIRYTSPSHEEILETNIGIMSLYDLSKMSGCKYQIATPEITE